MVINEQNKSFILSLIIDDDNHKDQSFCLEETTTQQCHSSLKKFPIFDEKGKKYTYKNYNTKN